MTPMPFPIPFPPDPTFPPLTPLPARVGLGFGNVPKEGIILFLGPGAIRAMLLV